MSTLRKEELDEMVMEYLVTEGHKEAAEELHKATGTAPNVSLDAITERVMIRNAVQATSSTNHTLFLSFTCLSVHLSLHSVVRSTQQSSRSTTSIPRSWKVAPGFTSISSGSTLLN